MGMSLGGKKGGAKSEINVTPLVDVCLVLLIIFMVMVPRNVPELSVRIPPDERRSAASQRAEEPLVIGMTRDGGLSLNRKPLDAARLRHELTRQLAFREQPVVFVDFDAKAPYGKAVAAVELAKAAGAQVVAIMKRKDEVVPEVLAPQ